MKQNKNVYICKKYPFGVSYQYDQYDICKKCNQQNVAHY